MKKAWKAYIFIIILCVMLSPLGIGYFIWYYYDVSSKINALPSETSRRLFYLTIAITAVIPAVILLIDHLHNADCAAHGPCGVVPDDILLILSMPILLIVGVIISLKFWKRGFPNSKRTREIRNIYLAIALWPVLVLGALILNSLIRSWLFDAYIHQ